MNNIQLTYIAIWTIYNWHVLQYEQYTIDIYCNMNNIQLTCIAIWTIYNWNILQYEQYTIEIYCNSSFTTSTDEDKKDLD